MDTLILERASLENAEIEHKRIEERLRANQAHLQGVLDSASSAIISTDEDQRIILFNNQAERTFGYREDEVLGKPLSMLLPDRFRRAHKRHVEKFATEDVSWRAMSERQVPLFGRRKDGEEFPIEVAISVFEEGGKPIFTAVLNDITVRKQVEEERDRLFAELKGLYEQQASYLEQVAHVTDAAAAIEAKTFNPRSLDEVAARTDELGRLGRVFQHMAREVYAREQELVRQVNQIYIEIDEAQAAADIAEIKNTETYKRLKRLAKDFRQEDKSDG